MKKGEQITVETRDGSHEMAEFISRKGGWVTVQMSDGSNKKFRASKVNAAAAEEDPNAGHSVIHPDVKARYEASKKVNGSSTQDNADIVARALRNRPLEAVYKIAKKICDEDFHARYEHLNHGMQRMNLGNRIRAAVVEQDISINTVIKGMKGVSVEKPAKS